jgi:TrpR-related protein YerC/YecD
MKQTITPEVRELFRAILTLTSEEECAALFDDLCTVKEMQDLSQRLQVATMLNRGEKYQTIEQVTGASTATISRVNKCLVYGSGGYSTVLARLDDGQGKE